MRYRPSVANTASRSSANTSNAPLDPLKPDRYRTFIRSLISIASNPEAAICAFSLSRRWECVTTLDGTRYAECP
ncbi:Uncharacterised protein [Mycobacterium tuberculosis]|uniref:Uncharacterized protein n=1 Tax=Mycobacterium tuberculosis TaxID=1773 RepID=A0A0T7LKB0_MYCTX|nr:Uncharacterised protein [Mycobacterium tuberculosis]CFE47023.1 Uncharacterised protein [Mycobacterium tuberculosis]CFS45709.1 Uncharacterised protein [Mycobacterium tuberculosis]CNM17682.1 Uncharacterised protein [Mycobacterium tuberculosis]COW05099.1 Uncharacterised protein [Mycobacterium tuberculosis]